MTKDEYKKWFNERVRSHNEIEEKLLLKSAEYRGRILEACTLLEYYIETFLANYFTGYNKRKADELKASLFSTEMFSFNAKRAVMCYIIKKYLTEKNKSGVFKKYSKIDNTLQKKIIPLRNIVAHRKISQTKKDIINFNGENIVLIGTQHQSLFFLNEEKVKKEEALILDTLTLLFDFMADIHLKNPKA